MAEILVTGGTGVLGSQVAERLLAKDAGVRILSRRERPTLPDGATAVLGDLGTGEGLADAVKQVEGIVHCASENTLPTYRRAKEVDVEGTRRLVDACRTAGVEPYLLYISIVGIDEIPLGYYRAKLETEEVIRDSGLPHTILRATQFHDLIHRVVSGAARLPVVFVPKGFRFQPVDAGEVADRMIALVEAGPSGRADDMGGPEVHPIEDLALTYLTLSGRRKPVVSVRTPGKVSRAFREGRNCTPEHADGRIVWSDWLAHRLAGEAGVSGDPHLGEASTGGDPRPGDTDPPVGGAS